MSLNGLDNASVAEAYQSCQAEAGGWFLLNYVSRDEMDIYMRGSGGVPEARAAIADYQDKSPLYGFMIFRRRKVLLKYTPHGLSRLLQARVAVHFQSVEEKFVPFDTVLHITTSAELTDAALTSTLSLHSAADSSRSSGGSQQQRKSKLDEILEDPKERPSYDTAVNEDGPPQAEMRVRVGSVSESAPVGTVSNAPADGPADLPQSRPATGESSLRDTLPLPSRKAAAVLGIPLTEVSSVSGESSASPHNAGDTTSLYTASISSLPRSEHPSNDETRPSTSTARPSFSDIYNSSFLLKPKVKLGPRPSVDISKAPSGARPVSTLPPGLRARQRRKGSASGDDPERPDSRASQMSAVSAVSATVPFVAPPPIPESPQLPAYRPSSSSASVKSMPVTLSSKSEKTTTEKRRLKMAMEMRKKQMQAAKSTPRVSDAPVILEEAVLPSASAVKEGEEQPAEGAEDVASDRTGESRTVPDEEVAEEPSREVEKEKPPKIKEPLPPSQEEEECTTDDQATASAPSSRYHVLRNSCRISGDHIKADSAIQIEVQKQQQQQPDAEDDHARRVPSSSPVSVEHSSELPSTGPSSISEGDEDAAVADAEAGEKEEAPQAEQPVGDEADIAVPSVMAPPTVGEKLEPSSPAQQTLEDVAEEDESHVMEETSAAASPIVLDKPATPSAQQELDDLAENEESHESQGTVEAVEAMPTADEDIENDATPTERSVQNPNENRLTITLQNHPVPKSSLQERRPVTPRVLSVETQNHITPDESEADVSDDEFTSELRNAEIQEAKPVQVTRGQSPVTAFFPPSKPSTVDGNSPGKMSNSSERRPSHPLRNVSGHSDFSKQSEETLVPDHCLVSQQSDETLRARFAAPASQTPSRAPQPNITVSKKVNISSGISQRIKALTRQSGSSDSSPLHQMPSRDSSGPSIVALRKSSLRDVTPPSRPVSSAASVSSTTARERAASFASKFSSPAIDFSAPPVPKNITPTKAHERIQAVYNVQQRNDERPSISVTARIVRDPKKNKENAKVSAPTADKPLGLHESPLIITHNDVPSVSEPDTPRRDPSPARSLAPPSLFVPPPPAHDLERVDALSPPTSARRTSSDNWRASISRHANRVSDSRSPTTVAKSPSIASFDTNTSHSDDGNKTLHERRSSRGSRMLKRMSNSISLGRKTIAQIVTSPAMENEKSPIPTPVSEEGHPHPGKAYTVEIGDLNVQLPDTLLWKRRWVEIDGRGNVVVRTSKSNEMASSKGLRRSFHMTEFRRPCVPDLERLEMPHSVVLDFFDGRTLQCACESGGGQGEVLRLLQEAHAQWNAASPAL